MATSVCRVMGSLLALVLLVLMAAPVAQGDGPLTYLKSVPLAAMAHDILVEGDLAYVATATGLTILDVADPANPTVRGSVLAPDECHGLAKKGSYIYLAAATGGMQVIDVSNPDAPHTVANAKAGWEGGNIWDVAVHPTAKAAYAASFDGELYVWDIAIPAAPRLTQTLGVLGWRYDSLKFEAYMRNLGKAGAARVTGVSVDGPGDHVFAGDWNYGRLYVWKATPDPLHLTFAHTHRTPVLMRVEADATRGWVFMLSTYDKPSGLYTFPYSLMNPLAATRWDKCGVCGFEKAGIRMDQGGLAISPNGRYVLYAGGRDTGQLRIMDVTNPSDPLTVHVEPLGLHKLGLGAAMGVAFRGDVFYVAAGALGVRIYSFPGLSP